MKSRGNLNKPSTYFVYVDESAYTPVVRVRKMRFGQDTRDLVLGLDHVRIGKRMVVRAYSAAPAREVAAQYGVVAKKSR